jgi:surface antigen
MESIILNRNIKANLLTVIFLLSLLSMIVLPMLPGHSKALAASDTYPSQWAPPVAQDSVYDTWREYNRECTSYASWMLHSVNGFEMPYFANAVDWGTKAKALGYTVDMKPAIGSIFWATGIDHVGWVESVSADGSTINYQDYNFDLAGHYSEHIGTATNSASGYIHFKDLGGNPPPAVSTLKTIATSDGHVQTFKITNGVLSENWYNWGAGSNRYGIWTQPVAMPSTPTGAPAIVQRTGQNKIDVFVRGSNNQIYETWYDYQYGTWGGWINMGGNLGSDPQAIDTSDAHEQVFGTGNNLVQQNWFNPNVTVNNFSGWTTSHGLPANAVGSPAVALRSGQTSIDEFIRGGDNQIYETWYDISNANWGGWRAMGGYVTSDPQVTTTSDGHDQVFGTGSNLVKQSWYYVNNDVGGWTTSAGLPGITTASSPASVLRTGQGRIDEFITGSNNQVYQTWYDSGVGNWGPWLNMGGTTTSDPQGIATSDGHDQIFGTNNSAVTQNWFNRVDGISIGGWITF